MNKKKLTFEAVSIAGVLALNPSLAVMGAEPDGKEQTVLESMAEQEESQTEAESPEETEVVIGAGRTETEKETGSADAEAGKDEAEEEEFYGGLKDAEDEYLSGTADADTLSVEMLSGTKGAAEIANPRAQEALDRAEGWLQKNVTNPKVESVGGEWSVLAMARYGALGETAKANYLSNLFQKLEKEDGVLHRQKYTEYSRVALALTSIGMNPTDADGYNILAPLADFDMVCWQGINGPIWALIALDTHQYEIPSLTKEELADGKVQTTRDGLIQAILKAECPGGGWTLSGKKADADMTGMALQALAPYKDRADVKPYIERGINKLAEIQQTDGSFGSDASGGKGCVESTAQVLTAFMALDTSLLEDTRFVKNGKTLLDAVMKFQLPDGSFEHVAGQESNGMATEQGTYALVAWYRAANGQTSLYDMTDVKIQQPDEGESEENIAKFKKKLAALPKNITLKQKDEVFALKAELAQMLNFDEKEEFTERLNTLAAELDKQEQEVKALDDNIWNSVNPLNVTSADKQKVEELLAKYNALSKENQAYVENAKDLLDADAILKKLEKGIIAKEVFEKVRDSKQNYTYKGNGYSLVLKGKNTYKPADMAAGIEIKEEKNQLRFATKADGTLPGEMEVVIECNLKDGVYMLYQKTGSKEKASQWTGVFDGKMSCDIAEGGEYILKKAEVKDETQAESTTPTGTTSTTKKPQTSTTTKKKTPTVSKTTTKKASNTIKAEVKDGIVDKKAFEEIKGSDKNLKIEGEFAKNKPYSLTINGKDVKKAADIKAGMKEGSKYADDIKKLAENAYVFQFEEEGDFPGKLQAEITADCEDGEYLLLKYNEKERKAEYVQKVQVKDKKTKFLASKGGTYFIAKKAKTKSVDEIEKLEKELAEKDKETENPKEESKVTSLMRAEEPEEDLLLEGTKEEKSHAGVIAAVVTAVAALAGGGAYIFYLNKKRKENEVQSKKGMSKKDE